MWDQVLPNATLWGSWLWEGFIRHFGMNNIEYRPIPDEGHQLNMGRVSLNFIPAHYLHSSGNFHVYDPVAKIFFSGDVGAALESANAPVFVEDFNAHTAHMKGFHQRWMPSNQAKQKWIERVRKLEIEMMVPQHGRIFRDEQVGQFLEWFESRNLVSRFKQLHL